MAGWADLVLRGQERLLDFEFAGTEGTDWGFALDDFTDAAGAVVDMSAATFVCKIITAVGGTDVATWTVTGTALGSLTGTLADTLTVNLAAGSAATTPRRCLWHCRGTLAGAVVQFWGPMASPFYVYPDGTL